MSVEFTNYVGIAPATTTMQIVNGFAGQNLGVCPPGYYGQNIMLPGAANFGPPAAARQQQVVAVNPYGTESKLSGPTLLGLGTVRWDYMIFAFGLAFAGVLGYAIFRKRR